MALSFKICKLSEISHRFFSFPNMNRKLTKQRLDLDILTKIVQGYHMEQYQS